jgi:hypothetical protein
MTLKHSNLAIVTVGSHTRVTADGAATLTKPAGATGILIQNTAVAGTATAGLKFTIDGVTAASATVGFILEAGDAPARIDTINNVLVFLDSNAELEYQWFKAL